METNQNTLCIQINTSLVTNIKKPIFYPIKFRQYLYVEGKFSTFAQLQTKFYLHSNNFFRCLQIRDYVWKYMLNFETELQFAIDECLKVSPYKDKFISNLYNKLLTINTPSSKKYKLNREKDMGVQIPDDIWEGALEYMHSCSNNARHCLIQFKIIHRLHYSKVKIHNIFPNTSLTCDKSRSCSSLPCLFFLS